MKNFRLTLIRWDGFLFRILFRDKKKTTFNNTRHAVWSKTKKKDFYAIFRCSENAMLFL